MKLKLKKYIIKIFKYKIIKYPLILMFLFSITITLIIKLSGDSSYEFQLPNKRIDDVTKLNSTQVEKIIKPKTTNEIINAIKSTSGNITIGGGKYSMGGQTSFENSLHIDMRDFNKIILLDSIEKTVVVQSGITWRDLQEYIDKFNLSVKIMQTYANFTVGGSISVNCHGRYIGHGPIISSVLELDVILANGEKVRTSRNENDSLFYSIIGGYGGIGVITNVKLQLVDNTKIERFVEETNINEYNNYFNKKIKNNKNIVFQNGDLYPPEYTEIKSVYWKNSNKELTNSERITSRENSYFIERNIVEIVSWGNFGKWFRTSVIDPIIYFFDAIVWRNKEASYDVKELEPYSREDYTYVLQEYFIPKDNIVSFTKKMKDIFLKYEVNVINVSLRHALPDTLSYLSWAPEEVFAFVVYYKQGTEKKDKVIVKKWTLEMTDAILSENGRWYLPYQPHATVEQFQKGYKNASKYFQIKNTLDSNFRFKNKLLDKYNLKFKNKIDLYKKTSDNYYKNENHSFLSLPEWYLVYNPEEYANFIQNNDPIDFPFYQSIDEYWKLYDRSMKLVSIAYEENEEYNLMLDVIGISTTIEYTLKLIYENTIGRIFYLFESGYLTEEEKVIIEANKAYSGFIYNYVWYEFNFTDWITKIWDVNNDNSEELIRRFERKMFFTLEFFVKSIYAKLIKYGAEVNYGESDNYIYLNAISNEDIFETENLKVVLKENDNYILKIKKWGFFTEELLKFKNSIKIVDISGNDEIAISYVSNKAINYKNAKLLYKSDIVTNDRSYRYVYKIETDELVEYINYCKENNIKIEHIYDY